MKFQVIEINSGNVVGTFDHEKRAIYVRARCAVERSGDYRIRRVDK